MILETRDTIVHLQIADPRKRNFPRDESGEPRYGMFFTNLSKIGYKGRISLEANSKDVENDARASLAFLKAMAAKYGG